MAATEDVYCTLVMSDSYLPGAAVLAHSLRDAGTSKKIAALVTLDTLLYESLTQLRELFDYVIPVHRIANPNLENLARLDRLDLRYTFTKLNLWRQEQFRKIVYIDADVVALRAPDELFDIDAPFAAAPDIGWPDCFNSGVMMLKPNEGEFWSLQTLAASGVSFDGADQGLLNEYYANRPWKRLSFTYNCTPSSGYQYEPAYRHYRSSISMAHFIGKDKPWTLGRSALESSGSGVYKELLGRWWSVFDRHHRKEPNPQIQQFVKDDRPQHDLAWAASGLAPAPTGQEHSSSAPPPPPEASHVTTEQPFTEATEQVQEMDHNQPEPPAFEPPQNQWDATRSAPPIISKAEASSFPTDTHYEMSSDRNLFQPPASYPEPPKNMYYSVPETKPKPLEEPKPIFPWEQNKSARKPTRVFAEALSRPSTPPQGLTKLSTDATDVRVRIPPPQEYSIRANAWDNDPGIEVYLRAYKEATARRGRAQPGHAHTTSTEALASPSLSKKRDGPRSLRLTDFPSSDERPSLPVTPAPIQRPTFWGQERDEQGELPAAEGVPNQAQWVCNCPVCGALHNFTPLYRESDPAVPKIRSTTALHFSSSNSSATLAVRPRTVVDSFARIKTLPYPPHLRPIVPSSPTPTDKTAQNPLVQLEELRRNSLLAAEDLEKLAAKETPAPLRETLPTAAPLPISPPAVEVPAVPKQDDASSGSATAGPTLLNPFEEATKEDEGKGATLIDPKSVLGSTAD